MAKLEVQIGADSSELKSEIARAEVEIEKLRKQKAINIKLGIDTVELQRNINDSKAQLANLKKSVDNTGASFSGTTPKVANGTNALMQFSRITQDANYGIMGMGNNITATVEAFGHLKQSTGSAGGALKAMAGSIMGTGGILLAVSLVTTAFTYMSMNGISLGDVIDKVTGKFDGGAKAVKQFKEDLAKLNETALSNATSETASLRVLANVINSETTSRKQKVESIETLQKMYPHIFSNLDKDSEKTKILTGDIDKLTEAIFAREAAEVFSSAAGKEYQNKIGYIQKYTNLSKSLTDLRMQRAGMEEGQLKALGAQDASNREAKIIEDIKATSILIGNSDKIMNAYVRNSATMAQTGFMATKPAGGGGGGKKSVTKRPDIVGIPKMGIAKTTDEENDRILAMLRDSLSEDLKSFANDPIILDIPIQPTVDITPAETEMQRIQNLLNEFNAGASELINGSIADTFGQLGTAIGTALANGGNVFKAIGNTILQGLGNFLSDMGGMLIKYGTLAVIKGKLDLAIATGGPAAIVAGIAAIGVGIALKAIGGAISAKASGQGAGATVQGGNSYSSPSSSNSGGGGGSFSGGTVVFEISGQTLIGVLSNTLDRNKRLGGSLAL